MTVSRGANLGSQKLRNLLLGSYPGSSYVGVCWPFTGDGSTFSK